MKRANIFLLTVIKRIITVVLLAALFPLTHYSVQAQLQYDEVSLPHRYTSMSIQLHPRPGHGIYGVGIADTTWPSGSYSYGRRQLFYSSLDSIRATPGFVMIPDTGSLYTDFYGYLTEDVFDARSASTGQKTVLIYSKQSIFSAELISYYEPIVRAGVISDPDGLYDTLFTRTSACNPDVAVDQLGGSHFVWNEIYPVSQYNYWHYPVDYTATIRYLWYPSGQVSNPATVDTGYFPQIRADETNNVHIIYFHGASSAADSFSICYVKGYQGSFSSPQILFKGARLNRGYSWAPQRVSFNVSPGGDTLHIAWSEGLYGYMDNSQNLYSLIVTPDSIHADSLVSYGALSTGMFQFRTSDRNVLAAWRSSDEGGGYMRYSSSLNSPLFSTINPFSGTYGYMMRSLFLDPHIDYNPSYIYDDAHSILYLSNLEKTPDTGSVAPHSFMGLADGATVDAKGNVYTAYYDSSKTIHVARLYGIPTGVGDGSKRLPDFFALKQNYPNPFNPSTKIEYTLNQRSQVRITVFNIYGQVIATPFAGSQERGDHAVNWNADGKASGVYFYRLEAMNASDTRKIFSQTKKMVLVR
jgi:hypothetical protein